MTALRDQDDAWFRLAEQLAELWYPTCSNLLERPIGNSCNSSNSDNGLEEDIEDPRLWAELYRRPTPSDGYICNICYQTGHYIQNCPLNRLDDRKQTPYQGAKCCVGEFRCPNCKRAWISRQSLANTAERCRRCNEWTYPKKQYSDVLATKLRISDKTVYKKPRKFRRSIGDSMQNSICSTGSECSSIVGNDCKDYSIWTSFFDDSTSDCCV